MRLTHNMPQVADAVHAKLIKQVPFALSQALNDTALDVKAAEEDELGVVLDNPTPFTRRGFFVKRSSKRKLVAKVGVKSIQAKYLRYQVEGGTRRPNGKALLVPQKARLNQYGNLPKGSVARSKAKKTTFVVSRGAKAAEHLRPGVYQRPKRLAKGSKREAKKLKQLVSFEASATYKPKFDPVSVARRVLRKRLKSHFSRRFAQAMATAR